MSHILDSGRYNIMTAEKLTAETCQNMKNDINACCLCHLWWAKKSRKLSKTWKWLFSWFLKSILPSVSTEVTFPKNNHHYPSRGGGGEQRTCFFKTLKRKTHFSILDVYPSLFRKVIVFSGWKGEKRFLKFKAPTGRGWLSLQLEETKVSVRLS